MTVATVAVVRVAVRSVDPVSQTSPGPVLLVPGYGGNVDSLQPLAATVRSAGRTVVIVEPVGDGTGDLRQQADHLAEVADSARAAAGARRLMSLATPRAVSSLGYGYETEAAPR